MANNTADEITCTILVRQSQKKTLTSARASDDGNKISNKTSASCSFPYGLVLDNACAAQWLNTVQDTRLSLPLDSKRPTVDRRFFCDNDERIIAGGIEKIVAQGLMKRAGGNESKQGAFSVHCNRYTRILEYRQVGAGLPPHTDGTKVCEDTGLKSTHTLLLFLSDCAHGGETVIMDGKDGWSKYEKVVVNKDRVFHHGGNTQRRAGDGGSSMIMDVSDGDEANVSVGVPPRIGRIVLFPHEWPHAGAVCVSLPKIMLRAEVTILQTDDTMLATCTATD
jgi:hypothetical protein